MEKITKDMLIAEVINKYPKSAEAFLDVGFFCFGCPGAQSETIEQGAKAHGFSDKQIQELIRKLNQNLKRS